MKDLIFRDRVHAGQLLAGELAKYANRSDVLVLGLPGVACPWHMKWRKPCVPRWT